MRYGFGKNWLKYIDSSFTKKRLALARNYLRQFTGLNSFEGKTVLDIGCGSGVMSLAALQLGAKEVVSYDYDINSVRSTAKLFEKVQKPKQWKIFQGSVLDKNMMKTLGTFDIVYSWGVLHHTGKMWNAIDEAAKAVKPNGLFYIAIYNKKGGLFSSKYWHRIKKTYNAVPWLGKKMMEYSYALFKILLMLAMLKNPITQISTYQKKRGMHWKRDIDDWLGGFPYEFATVDEIFTFCKERKFSLENISSTNLLACNEFLFMKK